MKRHPGLPPEFSGGREFWSDENMNARAVPASVTDFALLPGEDPAAALGSGDEGSLALRQIAASGGQLPVLALQEIEVDEGFRSADLAADYLSAPPSSSYEPQYGAPQHIAPQLAPADNSRLDRLEAAIANLTQILGGNK